MADDREHDLFLEVLWEHYKQHGRHDLPWRQPDPGGSFDPYKILVSELMLQQTQVSRVIPKYQAFLEQFPDLQALAAAPLRDVIILWSGLGYNRRAKFLHQAAQRIMNDYDGAFPLTQKELVKLPGIGKNTAGAIMTYAFGRPVLFVETNIRTVYIHHFFSDREAIHDAEILEVLAETLDHEHPREFYWALMDYGSFLKQTVGNLNMASKHYAKQSAFQGSRRQIRGQILRLLAGTKMSQEMISEHIVDERLREVLQALLAEGLIQKSGTRYHL